MRMLPLPPIPLMPPIRRSRWSPRGLIVASLVTAVSLALYATLQAAASPRSVQPLAGQAGTTSAGSAFPEDLLWWWPLNVGSAAGFFQCWPNTAKSSGDSVVVWTDKANHGALRLNDMQLDCVRTSDD